METVATYHWYNFDREVAVEGTLVGFRQADDNDLSQTGKLFVNKSNDLYFDSYKVVILGYTLWISDTGAVTKVYPEDGTFNIGETLQMCVCTMETTYGTQQGITRAPSSGSAEQIADISALEPRDHFAMQALAAMLQQNKGCEAFGDSTIIFFCRAAYRWAQGMMIAAADARASVEKVDNSRTPGVEKGEDKEEKLGYLDVNTNQITSLTDKLLYNIGIAVDNLRISDDNNYKDVQKKGLPVTGSTSTDAAPVKTEVTKMPEVAIKGTPKVEITNEPTVKVSNMPTEPISVAGTVSVDNFPSTDNN